jgi:spore coat protein A
MATRREVLKLGALAGAGMLAPSTAQSLPGTVQYHGHVSSLGTQPRTGLAQFVDRLPIPPVVRPSPGSVTDISMLAFRQKLHRDLPPTPLWGYNGIYPGPTFETRTGSPISVRWKNNLPPTHFLAVDPTIHGAESKWPAVRTVVHAHGQKVMPENDGYPEAWFTSDGQHGPELFNPDPFAYPMDQQAMGSWYHDHALGIVRLNIYAGLLGMWFIRDAVEDSLNIPKGQFEIPLMIQDHIFNPDGSLVYPVAEGGTHPFWIPEFFGDTIAVNGKVWPYLDVEPRRYRLRLLNACNARFLHVTLVETDANGNPMGMAGPLFNVIGTDGGLLPAPVALNDLLQAPAERFDVIVDFTGKAGKYFVLKNDAPAPFPGGGEVVPTEVMMFRVVKRLSSPDTSEIPSVLNPVPRNYDPASAVKSRYLTLSEQDRESDGFPIIALLGTMSNGPLRWFSPVTEDPKRGSIEIWNLINTTGDAHPKHIHLVQFQILGRQAFNTHAFEQSGKLVFTGPPQAPRPEEQYAYKDTVKTFPGTVTKLIMKFDLPAGANIVPGHHYTYVWHCHILEHEDNEMMRPYDVIG